MATATLNRSTKVYSQYDLIVDGVIVSTGHSAYEFAAQGKNVNGRFDRASELGISKVSDGVYAVSDLDKFNAFMAEQTADYVAPSAAYVALQNEGHTEPAFIDNTPAHPQDY